MSFNNDQVMTRYLSSAFPGHTTAEDFKLRFEEAKQNLHTRRVKKVSMDGPNVNWKMAEQNY